MTLSISAEMTLVEILLILMGIGITWLVYRGSEWAELPGEAQIPDPRDNEDVGRAQEGRTLG